MESRRRVSRGRSGADDGERHSREFMQLILHDVVLRKADTLSRRAVIAFSSAAISVLLRQRSDKSQICLSGLERLSAEQLDRLLCAVRYTIVTSARPNTRIRTPSAMELSTGKYLAKSRSGARSDEHSRRPRGRGDPRWH